MPETTTFTTVQAHRLSGLSLRQLQWWDEQGVVSPRQENHQRLYTAEKLFLLLVCADLRAKGIPLQRIRKILVSIRRSTSARFLITDGRLRIATRETPEETIEVIRTARNPLYLVDLQQIRERLSIEKCS